MDRIRSIHRSFGLALILVLPLTYLSQQLPHSHDDHHHGPADHAPHAHTHGGDAGDACGHHSDADHHHHVLARHIDSHPRLTAPRASRAPRAAETGWAVVPTAAVPVAVARAAAGVHAPAPPVPGREIAAPSAPRAPPFRV